MDINEINKKIETFLSFLTNHINLIFKPQKLVKYILDESIKKLIIKSILLLFMNYFIFKIIFEIINTSININYLQIPVIIVITSIVYCFCFPFIFISLKINLKEKIKLSVFSSIFIHNTVLPIMYVFLICFILTETYLFYFFTILINILINIFIFFIYPLFFNKKLFKAISILASFCIYLVINYSIFIFVLSSDKTKNNIYQDPIFHEFIEIQPKYLEIATYINENDILLINSQQKFIAEGNYSYYDILKNQMATIINKKNEIEIILSKIKFNRNKKCFILTLEIIDIYEKLLFEYNRLILDFSQNKLKELQINLQERIERIQTAREKLQILNEKTNEYQRANLPLSQNIIIEVESLKREIEQLSNEERETDVLIENMKVHGNAQREIISLTKKSNTVINNLINEIKKNEEYYNWRINIPF